MGTACGAHKRRTRLFARTSAGQGLVETAAMLSLTTFILVGGLMLLMSVGTQAFYKIKLVQAAESGSRYATESARWLGMTKPDYVNDPKKLISDVIDVVNDSLAQMGLPAAVFPLFRK